MPRGDRVEVASHGKPADAEPSNPGRAVTQLARRLMATGLDGLSEREQRLILQIATRRRASFDEDRIHSKHRMVAGRIADRVVRSCGSWGFILILTGSLVAWNVGSAVVLVRGGNSDPDAYVIHHFILSMAVVLVASLILVSMNRKTTRDLLAARRRVAMRLKTGVGIKARTTGSTVSSGWRTC